MEKKTTDDEQRPKFNLVCISNVKDSKTQIVYSEDRYGAHRSKDGATISLVDKSLAEVNDRLFQT